MKLKTQHLVLPDGVSTGDFYMAYCLKFVPLLNLLFLQAARKLR